MTFNGETKVITVSEDTPILEAAEKEWDVPSSCRNGICTTCAARVTAGADSLKVSQWVGGWVDGRALSSRAWLIRT